MIKERRRFELMRGRLISYWGAYACISPEDLKANQEITNWPWKETGPFEGKEVRLVVELIEVEK